MMRSYMEIDYDIEAKPDIEVNNIHTLNLFKNISSSLNKNKNFNFENYFQNLNNNFKKLFQNNEDINNITKLYNE